MPNRIFTSDVGDLISTQMPTEFAIQAGGAGSRATCIRPTGNLWSQAFAGGLSPAEIGGDIVVALATIPAGAFDQAGRQLTISAAGALANNFNSKRAKIIVGPTNAVIGSAVVGGTVLADTGALAASNYGWMLSGSITKTGSSGSDTQNGEHLAASPSMLLFLPTALTLIESAPITVAVTIDCVTANTDASLWSFAGAWAN